VAVISGGNTYPPLSWRRGDTLVGSSVDMVRQILADVGVTAKADEGGPWKRVLRRTRDGQVDILMGVRKSPDREHFLLYLDPPLTPSAQGVFFSAKHALAYTHWKDLQGKTGSITLGTNFDDEFDAYAREHLYLQAVRKVEQNFTKLEKGRVDYMLAPLVPTQLYIEKFGFGGKIVNADEPLMIIQEYVAISRKSPCLKHAAHISKALQQWTDNGRMNEAMENSFVDWFQEQESAGK
jgi:polar amino acid transport system substrate-binding protein